MYWTRPEESFARAFEAFVIIEAGEIPWFHGNRADRRNLVI